MHPPIAAMDDASLARALNAPQLRAVLHGDGPLLVFAGACSGKTRVITYRIARLIARGEAPWSVCAVTFTNKAAAEMRERLVKLVGPESARGPWVGTFHATGARILRRYAAEAGLRDDFTIYDDGDQRAVMGRVYKELDLDEDDRNTPNLREALHAVERAKQEVKSPDDLSAAAKAPREFLLARIYERYELHLRQNNAVDFSDLLSRTVTLLEGDATVRGALQAKWQHLLVDEFQDTNGAQIRMLKALVGPRRNLCVVGDDDQAIYAWRGADVGNILGFRAEFVGATVVKLEENYRCTGRILAAANAVIGKAQRREAKTLHTRNPPGGLLELLPCEDERAEGMAVAQRVRAALDRGVAPEEIAVFYRIHAQSRPLEEALRAARVSYRIVGGLRFYDRAEVKDLLAYLRLALNPDDDVQLLRVLNVPARKLGKTTVDRVVAYASARRRSLWKLIAANDLPPEVAGAARKAFAGFYQLVELMRQRQSQRADQPADFAAWVYAHTGYKAMLDADGSPEAEARRENVAELLGSVMAYQSEDEAPTLAGYLQRVTLNEETPSEPDATGQPAAGRVSLMSVHSAKGLEFDAVFLTGLEDGMFPYKGTEVGADAGELEEERRLAYVAITRARKQLALSYARFRQLFGQTKIHPPSRFLFEIPPELLSQPVPRRALDRALAPHLGAAARHAAQRPPASLPPHRRPAPPQGVRREDGLTYVPDEAHAHAAPPHEDAHRDLHDDLHDAAPPAPATGGSVPGWMRRGARVKHPKFGLGTIKSVVPEDPPKVEVYFPHTGKLTRLIASAVQPLY